MTTRFLFGFSVLLTVLAACARDETVFAYGAGERTWVLQEMNGKSFTALATMTFPEPGVVTGKAPCNSFSTNQVAPYPWFEVGALRVTKTACPALDQEHLYLSNLSAMTQVEVAGDTLILSNDARETMVFKSP